MKIDSACTGERKKKEHGRNEVSPEKRGQSAMRETSLHVLLDFLKNIVCNYCSHPCTDCSVLACDENDDSEIVGTNGLCLYRKMYSFIGTSYNVDYTS